MAKPAPTLPVGTIAAILLATLPAVATSQTVPAPTATAGQELNNQVQLGDVFGSQTVHVVLSDTGVSSVATSTGNNFAVQAVNSPSQIDSFQTTSGQSNAVSTAVADQGAGPSLTASAAATGNTTTAAGTGTLVSGYSHQTVAASSMVSASTYPGTGGGPTKVVSTNATALGNTQGWAAINGSTTSFTTQTESGPVHSLVQATVCCTTGTADYTSTAVANNVTGDTTNSTAYMLVNQTRDQGGTAANVTAHQTSGVDVTTTSTATANNLNLTGSGAWATVDATQNNASSVSATSDLSVNLWTGYATANAYGVGNSAFVSNTGSSALLSPDQTNTGDVTVSASFSTPGDGVGTANASAVGNAASVYACGACNSSSAGVGATSRQTNSAAITASSTVTSANGPANGTANAVGNSLTVQVKSH
jgi:hypothetical protein